MESVSSTTSAASDYGVQQFMRQAARRSAEQAEQVARSLKAQAGNALRAADKEVENARFLQAQSLKFKANNALQSADRAEKKASSLPQLLHQDHAEGAKARPAPSGAAQPHLSSSPPQTFGSATPEASIVPAVNGQNQIIGVLINTEA